MRVMRLFVVGLAVAAAAFLTLACGDDNEERAATGTETQGGAPAATQARTSTVSATLAEYSIQLSRASAPAGEVTFNLRNAGTIEHEFVVLKTDLPEAGLPIDSEKSTVDEDARGITAVDEEEEFAAGETKTLTVDLDPGRYVFICNIAGHYTLGMHTSFTVGN